MIFLSLTRLRVRSIRFLPAFAFYALRSVRQVRQAPGFREGKLLPDRRFAFWTMTAWDDQDSMRAYMLSGAHRDAMPHLMHWCDEASVAHWQQETDVLPSWEEADLRMRDTGRISKVNHPSPQHAKLEYARPRTSRGGPIQARRQTTRTSGIP